MRRSALLHQAIRLGGLPLPERIFPEGPICRAELHFFVCEETAIESSFDFGLSHIDTDEDHLLHAVAVGFEPEVGECAEAGFVFGPLVFGEGGIPEALRLGVDAIAGLGIDADDVVFGGEPEEAFSAENAGEDFV